MEYRKKCQWNYVYCIVLAVVRQPTIRIPCKSFVKIIKFSIHRPLLMTRRILAPVTALDMNNDIISWRFQGHTPQAVHQHLNVSITKHQVPSTYVIRFVRNEGRSSYKRYALAQAHRRTWRPWAHKVHRALTWIPRLALILWVSECGVVDLCSLRHHMGGRKSVWRANVHITMSGMQRAQCHSE